MKHIVLVLMIALLPLLGFAQGPVAKVLPVKIDLGIKAGANFANLNGKQWESGYKPGFVGGIFAGISRNRFGVTGEVLFSSVKYTGNGIDLYKAETGNYKNPADSAKKGDFVVSYLNIPILLNVKIFGPLWFQIGPQYSGVMSINDKSNLLKDTKGLLKSGDISGVLGLQINLPMGLRISGRYIIGLADMNASSVSDSWKTRTIQLGIGYSFL